MWAPYQSKLIDALESVQKDALKKLFPNVNDVPYNEQLDALKLKSLERRRKTSDLTELFKLFNAAYDVPFPTQFKLSNVNNVSTRGHSKKLQKTETR